MYGMYGASSRRGMPMDTGATAQTAPTSTTSTALALAPAPSAHMHAHRLPSSSASSPTTDAVSVAAASRAASASTSASGFSGAPSGFGFGSDSSAAFSFGGPLHTQQFPNTHHPSALSNPSTLNSSLASNISTSNTSTSTYTSSTYAPSTSASTSTFSSATQDGTLDFPLSDPAARKSMLKDSIFPALRNDASDPNIDSPEELRRNDPLGTQIWKLYSKAKMQLPNAERMENLTWRMMAMNMRRAELDRNKGYGIRNCSATPFMYNFWPWTLLTILHFF